MEHGYGFSLMFSDPWGTYTSVEALGELLISIQENLGLAPGALHVEVDRTEEDQLYEPGHSLMIMTTRYALIFHNYPAKRYLILKLSLEEELQMEEAFFVTKVKELLHPSCNILEEEPPDDVA